MSIAMEPENPRQTIDATTIDLSGLGRMHGDAPDLDTYPVDRPYRYVVEARTDDGAVLGRSEVWTPDNRTDALEGGWTWNGFIWPENPDGSGEPYRGKIVVVDVTNPDDEDDSQSTDVGIADREGNLPDDEEPT